MLGLALYLGAAVYDAAVVAPLWVLAPPDSVRTWALLQTRPDSTFLFQSLTAVVVIASTMAWMLGITERGGRRWWLTLTLASVAGLAVVVVRLVMPCERMLFGAAGLDESSPAVVVALAGDWIRGSGLRLAALVVGTWAAYRAQLAGMLAQSPSSVIARASRSALKPASRSAGGTPRNSDFAFGDEADEDDDEPRETPEARRRWRSSLPRRRRTAKK